MKTALLLTALVAAPATRPAWFSGCISYHLEARNAEGELVETSFGSESHFYIGGNSYKMLAAHQRLVELYDGRAHRLQVFGPDGRVLALADTARPAIRAVAATQLVLGYACRAVQVRTPAASSTVFYAPALRVDPAGFRARASGATGALLQATGGALPLRIITVGTAAGFTIASEATAVRPLPLTAADFTAEAPAR